MIKIVQIAVIMTILFSPVLTQAQKDSIRLSCPLDGAVIVPAPKNMGGSTPQDLSIILSSKSDTIVKALTNASVTNIERDDEGKYGVVLFAKFNNKDYYFWYTGMTRLLVQRRNMVKAGQALGHVAAGEKIELLMFQFETAMDPAKYLDCK